ncbi:MAG: dTDP-4-dehydrorhamnose reductase [Candidatus Poriferisodalaceae bacterium]|jgi:dTDP-4-dehydrorhamnose reductase
MSDRKKVLLTGANGQLAADLISALSDHELVLVDIDSLDITDREAVVAAVSNVGPEVILNCAAFTDVERCETEEAVAAAVNGAAPAHLVEAAAAVGGRVVHISTDYVFDGRSSRPYQVDDETNPQSAYGRTKLAGELAMRSEDLIVRTSWLGGVHGNNILKTVVDLADRDIHLKFVDDQVGHPTFSDDLARVLVDLIEARATGIVHATNAGAVSWFEFVQEVLDAMGKDRSMVSPISTSELDPPQQAPRPSNSILDNASLAGFGVTAAGDFRDRLPGLVAALRS